MNNPRLHKTLLSIWLSETERRTLNLFLESGGQILDNEVLQILIDAYERSDLR